jgi:hypothetical protein
VWTFARTGFVGRTDPCADSYAPPRPSGLCVCGMRNGNIQIVGMEFTVRPRLLPTMRGRGCVCGMRNKSEAMCSKPKWVVVDLLAKSLFRWK